jgi:hypothetical protein
MAWKIRAWARPVRPRAAPRVARPSQKASCMGRGAALEARQARSVAVSGSQQPGQPPCGERAAASEDFFMRPIRFGRP